MLNTKSVLLKIHNLNYHVYFIDVVALSFLYEY